MQNIWISFLKDWFYSFLSHLLKEKTFNNTQEELRDIVVYQVLNCLDIQGTWGVSLEVHVLKVLGVWDQATGKSHVLLFNEVYWWVGKEYSSTSLTSKELEHAN
jgi:hypothetical protein